MNERREGALLPQPQGRVEDRVRQHRIPAAARASRRVEGPAVRRIAILGGALAAVLLFLPTFPAAAVFQTMDVMVLAPPGEQEVGADVTLTVHVLRSGAHEDADSVALYRGAVRGPNLSVIRVDTGVYESTYRILPDDGMAGGVRIFVEAWIGGMRDQDVILLEVGRSELELSATPKLTKPGGYIDITVKVLDDGVPRRADGLLLDATSIVAGERPMVERLEWMELDVGTYMATYRVPRTFPQDAEVWLTARADVGGTIETDEVRVVVDGPDPLVVWRHLVSDELDVAVVQILAANESGWPAAGAAVSLAYEYFYDSGIFIGDRVVQATDERGIASFTINHTRSTSNVHFWGTVAAGSASVGFSGSLALSTPEFARKVDVLRDDPFGVIVPAEPATVRYTVLRGGLPLPSQTVYYFAHTGQAFVAAGIVTSDASGRFAIELTSPAGETTIDFSTQVGSVWVDEMDRVRAATPLSVDVGELHIGGVARISASLPAGAPPCIAFIEFRPFTGDWSLGNGVGSLDVVAPKGRMIEYDLVVPRFLPKGQEYLLSIEAIPLDPSSADRYVHVDTITLENRRPSAHAVLSPAVVAIGAEVEVNASASSDLDGVVEGVEVDWGDGTTSGWSPNATATHAYSAAGPYNVTVRVRDDDGAVGLAYVGVTVEATGVGIPPLTLIAIALAALGAAAAVPFFGPRFVRGLAKPGRPAAATR